MDIREFQDMYRVRIRRDDTGDWFVPCRRGQIYEHGGGRFGAMVIGRNASARVWSNVRRALLAAGFALHQDGDAEGSLLFDGDNQAQAEAAIRVMGAYRRRRYSPETLRKLTAQVTGLRNSAVRVRTKMALQRPESIASRRAVSKEGGDQLAG